MKSLLLAAYLAMGGAIAAFGLAQHLRDCPTDWRANIAGSDVIAMTILWPVYLVGISMVTEPDSVKSIPFQCHHNPAMSK